MIVDEVAKHWAAIVKPVLELVLALVVIIISFLVPPQAWWLPALAAAALTVHGLWRILQAQMDRFVITNMRVFRVHGILTQNIATMPWRESSTSRCIARSSAASSAWPLHLRVRRADPGARRRSAASAHPTSATSRSSAPSCARVSADRFVRTARPTPRNRSRASDDGAPPSPPAPPVDPFDDDGTGETLPERLGPNDTQPISPIDRPCGIRSASISRHAPAWVSLCGPRSREERGRVYGELPKRPKGSDCKSAGVAFGGSNPSLATRREAPVHTGLRRLGHRPSSRPLPASSPGMPRG